MKASDVDDILSSWTKLNSYLVSMSEKDVLKDKERDLKQLLEKEQKGARRRQILIRIHQKYSRIRTAREREELLGGKNVT